MKNNYNKLDCISFESFKLDIDIEILVKKETFSEGANFTFFYFKESNNSNNFHESYEYLECMYSVDNSMSCSNALEYMKIDKIFLNSMGVNIL